MNRDALTLDGLADVVRRWQMLYDDAETLWQRLADDAKELTLHAPPSYDVAIRGLVPTLALMHPDARASARALLAETYDALERITKAAAAWADRIEHWAPSSFDDVDVEYADERDRLDRLEDDVAELRRALAGASSVLRLVDRTVDDVD